MLKYLVIQLCDSAPSFCYYDTLEVPRLIDLETLRKGIIWSMKQNLSVQAVYPNYKLPDEYYEVLDTIEHTDIKCLDTHQSECEAIIVQTGLKNVPDSKSLKGKILTIRTSFMDFVQYWQDVLKYIPLLKRLNIVLTDIVGVREFELNKYDIVLKSLSDVIVEEYVKGNLVQFNLLTDRFMLDQMNNCNAGVESITLAPDGKFYVCPAFYLDRGEYDIGKSQTDVGNVDEGLSILNQRLYDINHAPLCRICDAYQCRRCVWLNRKTTNEVNTPSHEQCVISHIERNASHMLLKRIQEKGSFLPDKDIKEIDYLDPFDIRPKW